MADLYYMSGYKQMFDDLSYFKACRLYEQLLKQYEDNFEEQKAIAFGWRNSRHG